MLTTRRFFLTGLAAGAGSILLAGCQTPRFGGEDTNCDTKLITKLSAIDLSALFSGIAEEICTYYAGSCAKGSLTPPKGVPAIMVTDFVELESLQSDKSGLLMGELMRSYLMKNCCRTVIQAEVGKDIRINDKGTVSLTRQPNQLMKSELEIRDIVIGTYHNFTDKLVINVKIIDIQTQAIKQSVVKELKFSCSNRTLKTQGVLFK
jgi:hypothetical protein